MYTILYLQQTHFLKEYTKNFKDYTILYIQHTQFFKEYTKILYIQHTQFFKECTQLCIFNVYNSSKNIYSSVCSTYTFFHRM